MKWQDVAKILGIGGVGVIGLFTALFMLQGVTYSHSGDSICNGLTCEAYINVSTTYWAMCFEHSSRNETLFKKQTFSRTLWINLNKIDNIVDSNPDVEVDWLVPAVGKNNWREIKDGDCWSRGKVNKNKLIFHSTQPQVIKWSFVMNESKINIDPLLTSWDYIYPNKTIMDKEAVMNWTTCWKWTYKNVTIEVPCDAKNVTEKCFKCKVVNVSQTDCKNFTYQVQDKQVSYDCWQEVIIEVEKTVPDTSKKREGIQVGNKTIIDGNINVINNTYLIEWLYEIGDRNFVEYGDCRKYESDKGVCSRQKLDSPNLTATMVSK